MAGNVELGCGLIAIGRPWGAAQNEVPSESDAMHFLDAAFEMGIRDFDTAPSYGLSEERLGNFLRRLSAGERSEVSVSTKCGEYWDADTDTGTVDHTFDTLQHSISRSLAHLGKISVMQIHKAKPDVLASEDVAKAIEYARGLGIANIGASASDPETANMILDDPRFGYLQVPHNHASPQFLEPIERSREAGVRVLTNRPFLMGWHLAERKGGPEERRQLSIDAFTYILQTDFDGVVLSGTSNPQHLRDNIAAFEQAREDRQSAS